MANHPPEDPGDLDPITKMLGEAGREREHRQRQHAELRASPQFTQLSHRLHRLTFDFAQTLRSCWLVSTRHTEFVATSFFLRNIELLVQSALMTGFAIREGYLNPGRRELRFLLELSVQSLFTDEQMGRASFDARREFFKYKVENASVDHVRELRLELLPARGDEFRKHVVATWATSSAYVHPSPRQLDERFRLAEQGTTLGFESVEELRNAVDEAARAFGIGVVVAMHAIGPSFTGDLLVDGLDEQDAWSFHADPFVAAIDEHFDYKHERQTRLAEIRTRRAERLRVGAWTLNDARVALLVLMQTRLRSRQ